MTRPLIHLAETLAIGSIEGFLCQAEIEQLGQIMTKHLARYGSERFDAERGDTIHEIPGHSAEHAMAVYEPAGRLEVRQIPSDAEQVLQAAFERSREALNRSLPSVTLCRPWTYVEYGPGQHITAHLDGIAPDPLSWPRQIAGISVVISEPERGGSFHVETTSDRRLWRDGLAGPESGYAPGTHLAHDGADHSTPWFVDMQRTRWTATPESGTALLYGSQLAHGTEPVLVGVARKFISWLAAE
jgi:hypothetical protein